MSAKGSRKSEAVLRWATNVLFFDYLLFAETAVGDVMDAAQGVQLLGDGKEVGALHHFGDGGDGRNVGSASGGSAGHGDEGKGGNGNVGDVGAGKHVCNLDVCVGWEVGLITWVKK